MPRERPFHSPTAAEIDEAAEARARMHLNDRHPSTDPDGGYTTDRSIRGWLNPATASESAIVSRDEPLAYRRYINAYLRAQGWKR